MGFVVVNNNRLTSPSKSSVSDVNADSDAENNAAVNMNMENIPSPLSLGISLADNANEYSVYAHLQSPEEIAAASRASIPAADLIYVRNDEKLKHRMLERKQEKDPMLSPQDKSPTCRSCNCKSMASSVSSTSLASTHFTYTNSDYQDHQDEDPEIVTSYKDNRTKMTETRDQDDILSYSQQGEEEEEEEEEEEKRLSFCDLGLESETKNIGFENANSVPDFDSLLLKPQLVDDYEKDILFLENELSKTRHKLAAVIKEPRQDRETLGLVSLALTSAFVVANFAIFSMAELQLSKRDKDFEALCMGAFLLALGSLAVLFSIPATQLVGEWLNKGSGFQFYQPMEGGFIFVAFQAFGWTTYALSLFGIMCWVALQPQYGGLLTLSGVFGCISQVLIECSLLTYKFNLDEIEKKKAVPRQFDRLRSRSNSVYSSRSGKSENVEAEGLERDLWLDSNLKWNRGRDFSFKIDNDTASFLFFALLNGSLLLVALGLSFITEFVAKDDVHRVIAASLSLVCVVVTASITHGLGGILYHNAHGWRFIQPFVGGTYFCLLQGITWAIFAVSVMCQFLVIVASAYLSSRLFLVSGLVRLGSLTALIGHLGLSMSLRYYRGARGDAKRKRKSSQSHYLSLLYFCEEATNDTRYLEGVRQRMNKFSGVNKVMGTTLVAGLCNIQYVIFVYVSFAFYAPMPLLCGLGVESMCYEETPEEMFPALFKFSMCIVVFTIGYSTMKTFNVNGPIRVILLIGLTMFPVVYTLYCHHEHQIFPLVVFLCFLYVVYNFRTYSAMPEMNGSREWEAFRNFRWFWQLFQDYLGGQVVKDQKLKEYEERKGILGTAGAGKQFLTCFHPHGIYPTTCIWLPNSPMWKQQFPHFRPNGHTASIIHLVPIMRDLSQWAGVRDVGRASVDNTLKTGVSPMLVVGGQSEMFLSRSSGSEILLHRRHRGFVRMAIKHGVPLLPVFSFGEHKTMDNIYLPKMQAYFKSKLGFPVPYFPYGRWYLPVLRRTPINICVGAPIFPTEKTDRPTRQQIDDLHNRYFEALEDLFERNKKDCGYPNHKIRWVWD